MAGNLRKFVNPRFVKTIDLALMRTLLGRHSADLHAFTLADLDLDEASAREKLQAFLAGAEESYPEGLRGDLHRIAELGDARGLEIILNQADRHGVNLFPELKASDADAPNKAHDPKHIAVRVFLEHPELFDAAADHMAMMTSDRLHEFVGQDVGVAADLSVEKVEAFRVAMADLFRHAFQGDYCRIGDYADADEVNIVISHGSVVSTMPIVEGQQERVISIRQITHPVLRYSENTGMLRMARIRKAQQAEVAELFATHILGRPGFFEGDEAQLLYSLDCVERAGNAWSFDWAYDPLIDRVDVIEAAADLMVSGKSGQVRVARTLRSRDVCGDALKHFANTPVTFGRDWRLSEMVFRVTFKSDGKRQPQVTVKLRAPGALQFRRTQHEARILTLIHRNGLMHDRTDFAVVDAAE